MVFIRVQILLLVLGVCFLPKISFAQTPPKNAPQPQVIKVASPDTKVSFAISLVMSVNSQVATFSVVHIVNGKVIKTQFLTIDEFIMQVSGRAESAANPDKADLLQKHKLFQCFPDYDMVSGRYIGYYCPLLSNLWKIRYKRDPYNANQRADAGWAGGYFGPNFAQTQYLLKRYQITNLNDYIIGENMFLLLTDVIDTAWQNNYRNLK
jgi:hypothetical protein